MKIWLEIFQLHKRIVLFEKLQQNILFENTIKLLSNYHLDLSTLIVKEFFQFVINRSINCERIFPICEKLKNQDRKL